MVFGKYTYMTYAFHGVGTTQWRWRRRLSLLNDKFCIKNDAFCIYNDESFIENDELCIKMMNSALKMMNSSLKMMNLGHHRDGDARRLHNRYGGRLYYNR